MTSPFLHDAAMFTLSGIHDTEAPIELLEYFETAGVFGEGEGKGESVSQVVDIWTMQRRLHSQWSKSVTTATVIM